MLVTTCVAMQKNSRSHIRLTLDADFHSSESGNLYNAVEMMHSCVGVSPLSTTLSEISSLHYLVKNYKLGVSSLPIGP